MRNGNGDTAQPDFVSLKELADRLGVHYRTVHRAVQSEKIRTVQFGSLIKVPRKEFERILLRGF